jgi:sarcosine oxidase subunit alpha
MGSLRFEGRTVPFRDGDTVAAALYRTGVRTFTRSLKHHRPRGLSCGTGDCANCLLTIDGRPGLRSCTTACHDGMRVEREGGWPSVEHDLLRITDRLHRLMPVGFSYKVFVRPRFAWEVAERLIRRATGVGTLPAAAERRTVTARHAHHDTVVVGAGVSGLSAALEAVRAGRSVLIADEGRVGAGLAPGPTLERVRELEADVRSAPAVTLLEDHVAVGVYEGPTVPLVSEREVVVVHPRRVVVATGAAEVLPVFPGNDLPGVWLGRGAARLAGVHGVRPAAAAVIAASSEEGLEHLGTIRAAGTRIAAALVPSRFADRVPADVRVVRDGIVERAEGRGAVRAVVVREPGGRGYRIGCDGLVLSLGLAPRDALARMGRDGEVEVVGDAAGRDATDEARGDGYVCLCEDVTLHDLEQAWREGFTSAEILKRYTTATMGPCQGAMCARHLTRFVERRAPATDVGRAAARPTARPPARPVRLGTLAATVHETIDRRTSLHELHVEAGAVMDRWSGWLRPNHYVDPHEEIRAVREAVGLMDVGTLGAFLIAGRDALELVDRVFPCRVRGMAPGRTRYVLALDEAGYVMDDGLLCALEDGAFFLTSTSGGAPRMEAWLRDWADRLELHVHLVDQTSQLGAVNVAGPRARDLLGRLSNDPLDEAAFPYPGHREIVVAGIGCRAIRTGFVGELAFELHHPRSRGPELWCALMEAGGDLGVRPHGLDALELLRLEKGHLYIGQDTLPDDTPVKLGLEWAVDMDKPWFVGKVALERMAALPPERRLVGLLFSGGVAAASELRGMPLLAGGRVTGRVTSAGRSEALDLDIGLGWVRAVEGRFPGELRAGDAVARIVPTPFYDPEGARVRG